MDHTINDLFIIQVNFITINNVFTEGFFNIVKSEKKKISHPFARTKGFENDFVV